MLVYRIAKARYVDDLTGTGAKRYGGRWNPKGLAVLYTSEHRSLAALEMLVHVSLQTVPDDLRLATIELPDDAVETLDPAIFAEITASVTPERGFREVGRDWLASVRSLALRVPSVLIPAEHNVLVSPEHPAFAAVRLTEVRPFALDARLLGGNF